MRFHKVSSETGKQQLIYVITHYGARQFSNPSAEHPSAEGSSSPPCPPRKAGHGDLQTVSSAAAEPGDGGDRRSGTAVASLPSSPAAPRHGRELGGMPAPGLSALPVAQPCPGPGGPRGKGARGSAALWGKRRQRHKGKAESIKYF